MLLLLYNLELLLHRRWLRIGTSRSQNVRIATRSWAGYWCVGYL